MADTHKDRIEDLAPRLAQLSTQATSRLTSVFAEVYALACSRMEEQLGSSGYGDYVALFDTAIYLRDTEYFELTKGQRKLRLLESAEAYYLLYYFTLSLKELQNKSVLLDENVFGEGALKPSEIEELIRMRDTYLNEGDGICSKFGYSGGISMGSV